MSEDHADGGEHAVEVPAAADSDPLTRDPLSDLEPLEADDSPSEVEEADEVSKKPAARRSTKDPFADDPLAELPQLDLDEAPPLERDPFAAKAPSKSKAKPAKSKPEAQAPVKPKPAAKAPKAEKAPKDPFADDPLAELPQLDPDEAPPLKRDPFAAAPQPKPKAPVRKAKRLDADEGGAELPPAAEADQETEQSEPGPSSTKRPPSKRPPPAAWRDKDEELLAAPSKEPVAAAEVSAKQTSKAPPKTAAKPPPDPKAKGLEVKARSRRSKDDGAKPGGPEAKPKPKPKPKKVKVELPEPPKLPEPMEQPPPSDSRLEPAPPALLEAPSGRGRWVLMIVAIPVLGVALAGWAVHTHLEQSRLDETLSSFLDRAPHLAPAEVVADAEGLPESLQADPRVSEVLEGARRALAVAAQREAAQELVHQAQTAADPEEALKLCNRAIVTYDGCAEAHGLRARLAYERTARSGEGDYREALERALEDLDTALRADPTCGLAYWERARLRWPGRNDPAVRKQLTQDLADAERNSPQAALGSLALGYSLLLEGHDRRALRQFDAALERDASSIDARVGRARALVNLGETLEADRAASEAQKLAPQSADPLALRGFVRWVRGQHEPARADLTAALAADPWRPEALGVLSRLGVSRDRDGRLELGDVEARKQAALRALEVDPRQPLAHLTLGEIDESRGRSREAEEHFAASIAAGAREPGPRLARGLLRVRQRQWVEGEGDLAEVLTKDPEHPLALAYAGAADVELERWRSAGKRLERVLAQGQPPTIAWRYAGLRALRVTPAEPEAAFEQLSKALEVDPLDAEGRFFRAEALLALDRPAEARDDLLILAEGRGHGRVPAVDRARLLGHALFALDEFAGAREAYAAYLKDADPDDPHRGLVRRRVERCDAKLRAGDNQDF